jgi:hypothetical protein
MREFRLQIGAAALLILLLAPCVLKLEFFADDYHMGREIARASAEDPGFASAVRDAFARRWTNDFDVFRPLTILSLQWDWWLHGADPGRHHLTNLLLWLLVAILVTTAASSLSASPPSDLQRAAFLLALGFSPATVECLSWCVAREDLLCALFALVALLLQLRAPRRSLLRAAAVATALLAKETAVTLPLILLWTDLVLCRPDPDGKTPPWRTRVVRALPMFVVLLAGLALRHWLFGRVAGLYLGRPFTAWLSDAEMPARVLSGMAGSILALLAPVSRCARLENASLIVPTLVLASASCLGLALTMRTRAGLRHLLAFLPWILGPLALAAVPLSGVSPDLEKSRLLVLPLAALACVVAPRCFGASKRVILPALILVALASIWGLWANFQAWHRASATISTLRSELSSVAAEGDTVVLEGAVPRATTPSSARVGIIPELISRDGAYVLSQGLSDFTRPPFAHGPTLALWPTDLGTIATETRRESRSLALVALSSDDGSTQFKRRTPRATPGTTLCIDTNAVNTSDPASVLRISTPSAGVWRVVLIAPEEPVAAHCELTTEAKARVEVPLRQFVLRLHSGAEVPLDTALLRQLSISGLFAWVESADGSTCSPTAFIRLAL